MRLIALLALFFLFGCAPYRIQTEFDTNVCIKSLGKNHYLSCKNTVFRIENTSYTIPFYFETNLDAIPRPIWWLTSNVNSYFIRALIVHDWFYKKTCDFNRKQTDLIFYRMLINDGISTYHALMTYYMMRIFGSSVYNEDYCE